jgi:uncharacterized protein Yka (UPF0111/DUF47 family)
MSSSAGRRFHDLFDGVASKRERSEAVATCSRRTMRMVEEFRVNLLAKDELTDEEMASLAQQADGLERAVRLALHSEIGVALTIPRTLASVRLDQPEHAGLLDGEADAVEALSTSLRSAASAIRLTHEMRRRAQPR